MSGLPISCIQKRRRNVPDPSSEVLETADLLKEIILKLPVKTVFGCTLVSTFWNNIITDLQNLRRFKIPRNPSGVYVRRVVEHNDDFKLTHLPLEGVTGGGGAKVRRSSLTLTLFENKDFNHIPFVIEHSGQGLMICSSSQPRCYFLYNPTTNKRVRIPRPNTKMVISMNLSFQAPGTHKIVAVCLPRNSERLQLQVLERNYQNLAEWRNVEVEFPILGFEVINYGYGVNMDGVLYWPCYKSSGLMIFNVREETLRWLPEVPQPYTDFNGIAYFGECKGNLRMVVDDSMRGATFDMLELKTDRSMWFIRYHIDLEPRAPRADPMLPFPILVLALLPGEEEDDSYLIVHLLNEVVSYNLKDRTIRKLFNLGLRSTESILIRGAPWDYVHPYLQNTDYPTLTAPQVDANTLQGGADRRERASAEWSPNNIQT